jgi:putative transposase
VQRPRVRAADGSGELPVAAYQLFSGTEVLGRLALERMLGGLSTRRYPLGLEPVGSQAEQAASGTSKSAVSRRFVAMTHTALAELMNADLSGLDLVCLLVDGVHFAEHCGVVALGIDLDGTKHPLALVEGASETATLARELLVGLRERGLDVTRPTLVVIDGARALRRAVLDVFGHPVIARCQQHKIRNVRDKLPERLGGPVEHRMRSAYHAASALDAEAQLLTLARELHGIRPEQVDRVLARCPPSRQQRRQVEAAQQSWSLHPLRAASESAKGPRDDPRRLELVTSWTRRRPSLGCPALPRSLRAGSGASMGPVSPLKQSGVRAPVRA